MHSLPEIIDALGVLSRTRPLYHSEADFQHALAWQLRSSYQDCDVRLEVPMPSDSLRREHLDLLVIHRGKRVAIELKYKTRRLRLHQRDEVFDLQSHGAQDLGRYDFLLDVQRVERFIHNRRADHGFAILLTNDASYWSATSRGGTVDEMFRLLEGRVISGALSWLAHASEGTTRGRTAPVELRRPYTATWRPYSSLGLSAGSEFKFLALEVA